MAEKLGELKTRRLSRTYAEDNAERLAEIARVIPYTSWTPEKILAEEVEVDSKVIPYLSKWDHSFVLENDGNPIALAMGYETSDRFGIKQAQYLGTLACDRAFKGKGLGEGLLRTYLHDTLKQGYVTLPEEEDLIFMLETGAAPANAPVRALYDKYGYVVDHENPRDEGRRMNVIMVAKMGDVAHALASLEV